ncbi:MAG: hypothetical protein ACP5KD_07690 [Fervidobacterium sp.]
MKTNRTYVVRRKKEHHYVKPASIFILVILLVIGLYVGVRVVAIKNSEEFDLKKLSVYFLRTPESSETAINNDNLQKVDLAGKIIIVDGEKRVVNVINIPKHLYIFSKGIDVSNSNARDFALFMVQLLGFKPDYVYSVILKKDYLNKINVGGLEELVSHYGKQGLSLIDYLTIKSHVSILRPDSVITESALAKLYYSLGRFNIRTYEVPTITSKPIKIIVGDKIYIRTYADEEKFVNLISEIKR